MRRSTCSSSCVKIYLCSNPEDSVVERRALRENVFPKVRQHCRLSLGLDLRVIDPFESRDPSRWPDENTRRQLIQECRESSAGPFLLALIGHQYGSAHPPVQVEVPELQLLLQEGQQAGVCTVGLEREYERDENSIPPSYCLRAAQSREHVEDEAETEEKTRELLSVFQTAVSLCVQKGLVTPERAHCYFRSALDTDLRSALTNLPNSDISRHCLVYIHKVINPKGQRLVRTKSQTQHETARLELETTPTEELLLSELCDSFLPGLITSSHLLVYTVSTECDCRHGYTTARRRSYAESLCQQVYSDLLELTDAVNVPEISEDSQMGEALARDQTEHEELCDILSSFYDITRSEEEQIRAYLESELQRPLVVTGGPCTGKTVLLAHCAQKIKSWFPDIDPVVVTYFCHLSVNTSPEHLLSSFCYQIVAQYRSRSISKENIGDLDYSSCLNDLSDQNSNLLTSNSNAHDEHTKDHIYDKDLSSISFEDISGFLKPDICLSELHKQLSLLLSLMPTKKQPLILVLVGLDRLDNNFGLELIKSLPSSLPPSVKLILSVSSSRTQLLQAFNQQSPPSFTSKDKKEASGYVCVELGQVDRKQCLKMLESLLRSSGRRVTSGQQVLLNQALTSCHLPLYARLLHMHTSLWHSDSDVTESSLPDGVHSSISALLDHLEKKHGRSVVAHAVSYLTLSRTGLTEAELADLLSTDDMVQSEYIQQDTNSHTDSRILQIDVECLLLDLKEFLLKRTIGGSRVLFWVSRHFKLVAARKYCGSPEVRRGVHSAMADYFSGKQTPETKEVVTQTQQSCQLTFTSSFHKLDRLILRKVFELPHHLQESNQWEELESGLLMSMGFHQAMLQAGLLKGLVAMLEHKNRSVHSWLPREKAILSSILKSCACLLQSSPSQLPTLMESSLTPYLEVFPALELYIREIKEERKRRGSGLGVLLCPAPSLVPSIQCLRPNARPEHVSVTEAAGIDCGIVAEVMDDGTAWVWKGCRCDEVKLSLSSEQKDLKFAGVKSSGEMVLLSTQCSKLFLWDVSGPQVFLEVKDHLKTESGQKKATRLEGFVTSQKKLLMWWGGEDFVSMFHIPNETLAHFKCQSCVTCLACCSDGVYIYCGQEDGTVSLFDTSNCSLMGTCSNSSHTTLASIIFCENKLEMACIDKTGNVSLWGLAAKSEPPRLVKEIPAGGGVTDILNTDYSEEHNTLLVCHSHQVTLWETCNWELWDQYLAPQGKAFRQASLSQDGHLFLALLDGCPLVLVWRISTGECVLSLETTLQPYTILKTAKDIICVSDGGCLKVWDSEMIEAAGAALKMGCRIEEVVADWTGEHFYTSDGSETVWKWRLRAGSPHAYFLHDGPVVKMLLSPDDANLVTLSGDDIYVWKIETGQNILRISGSRATDILIAPNGQIGVSISDRYLSRVWKLAQGSIVCSINQYLSDAKVTPESTFLIGIRHGDLLAASLWTGSISKRFSCVMSSEHVVAFSTLPEHPDFVVVMATSGAVLTWKVAEETVCQHFHLPHTFHCQPQDFCMGLNGSYALLSTENEAVNLLDLSQVRLCSFKAEGPIIKACLDETGCHVAYISHPSTQKKGCVCSLHARPILTVVQLADGERVGSVRLWKSPSALVVCRHHFVFVGFEDGSVGVYSFNDILSDREDSVRRREKVKGHVKQCPFDKAPLRLLHLTAPNIKWP